MPEIESLIDSLFIVLGLILLIGGGNGLVKSAVALSLRLSIPKILIGMTVVSLATSAPELILSVKAALDGFPDLAFGNVVGSNIANLGLVLAITALLGSIEVRKSFYTIDWPVMMLATLLFMGFIYYDGTLSRFEGIIMVFFLIAFLIFLLRFQKKEAVIDEFSDNDVGLSWPKTMAYLCVGGVALWGGSELLIDGAIGLASTLGVSDRIIGVTVVSVGTSIPELAASVIAVLKKEKAISLGNLIGSNIFNLLAVLGITAIITPISVIDQGLLNNDIYWMLGISFLVLPLVFFPKGLRLGWREGMVLIVIYGLFVFLTVK